jgi:hypothetical protein
VEDDGGIGYPQVELDNCVATNDWVSLGTAILTSGVVAGEMPDVACSTGEIGVNTTAGDGYPYGELFNCWATNNWSNTGYTDDPLNAEVTWTFTFTDLNFADISEGDTFSEGCPSYWHIIAGGATYGPYPGAPDGPLALESSAPLGSSSWVVQYDPLTNPVGGLWDITVYALCAP